MASSKPSTPSTPYSPYIPTLTGPLSVPPVKSATPDIILFDDESVPIEVMADLIFENIGGQELINIARFDTINGQNISYQPIKNLSLINQQYNPNNILGLQQTSNLYFSGFAIKLEDKIPKLTNSPDNNPVYMDSFGNIVVEAINLNIDDQIEIQIIVSGTIYDTEI
jgi:hypothetical protein